MAGAMHCTCYHKIFFFFYSKIYVKISAKSPLITDGCVPPTNGAKFIEIDNGFVGVIITDNVGTAAPTDFPPNTLLITSRLVPMETFWSLALLLTPSFTTAKALPAPGPPEIYFLFHSTLSVLLLNLMQLFRTTETPFVPVAVIITPMSARLGSLPKDLSEHGLGTGPR